jgi:hypothetical protein
MQSAFASRKRCNELLEMLCSWLVPTVNVWLVDATRVTEQCRNCFDAACSPVYALDFETANRQLCLTPTVVTEAAVSGASRNRIGVVLILSFPFCQSEVQRLSQSVLHHSDSSISQHHPLIQLGEAGKNQFRLSCHLF